MSLSHTLPILNDLIHLRSTYLNHTHYAHTSTHYFDPDFIAAIVQQGADKSLVQIVLDTGCTFAISPERSDFVTYHRSPDVASVQSAGGPTNIVGHGIVP